MRSVDCAGSYRSCYEKGVGIVPTYCRQCLLKFAMATTVDTANVENFLHVVVVLLKNVDSLVNIDDVVMAAEDDGDDPLLAN